MFNKFFLFFFVFILFLSFASALKVVFPVEAEVFESSVVELGSISPGQTFELIVFGERFTGLKVNGSFSSWAKKSEFNGKNISIKLAVPENVSLGAKKISFTAFNQEGDSFSFDVLINVKKDLWSVSVPELSKTAKVNSLTQYDLVFYNESIGEQLIAFSSSLPSFWVKEKTFVVEPKSVLRDSIYLVPRNYGQRDFTFSFKSNYSGERKNFRARLFVESSLSSKYSSVSYGFPFFTLNLFPYYLVESLFSLFFQFFK
jgi:hypothetical protein